VHPLVRIILPTFNKLCYLNIILRIMNNTTLGIGIALMAAALIVGGTLAYNSANALMVVGKPGGTAGNGLNGGFIHTNGTGSSLNGANGNNANGVGATSVR
jgi:hypothetical protein